MQIRSLIREATALVLAGITLMLALALYSFSAQDPSLNHATDAPITNLMGAAGAYAADFLYQCMGYAAWFLMVLCMAVTIRMAMNKQAYTGAWTSWFWLPVLLGMAAWADAHHLWLDTFLPSLPAAAGGASGRILSDILGQAFHPLGRDVLLGLLILSSFVTASHISLLKLSAQAWQYLLRLMLYVRQMMNARKDRLQGREQRQEARAIAPVPRSQPDVAKPAKMTRSRRAHEAQQGQLPLGEPEQQGFKLPSLGLFVFNRKKTKAISQESLEAMARMLEKKLLDYRVEGEVLKVQPGPVVTQFEFEPAPGTKVSRVVALQDDLARSLSAVSVRVAGNIPGKTVIGIELPNQEREIVYLKDVMASKEFSNKKLLMPLAFGVDIAGAPVVTDLAKMPHLLIAGTTGSGKSVGVNGMICSLLMAFTPKDLRMILVDPKMLELSMYDDIPHLLVPVVTNPSKAAKALAWAVFEMERRYTLMSEAKVRNIAGYNRMSHLGDGEEVERLPYIVIVIDELADLMMVAGRDVEQAICRLAQKARASGIHLILATQRPSVDVITGLIKSNLPSRLSFQVSSRIDSRTILDQMGAEQLLGNGDSLFLSGGRNLQRVHGAFLSDAEVISLVDHLKTQGKPDYQEALFEIPEDHSDDADEEDADPKYDEAVDVVIHKGQCSVSMVQRQLRIGYNRASRIVEHMERDGVVTPPGAGGVRKVLARSMEDGGGVIE